MVDDYICAWPTRRQEKGENFRFWKREVYGSIFKKKYNFRFGFGFGFAENSNCLLKKGGKGEGGLVDNIFDAVFMFFAKMMIECSLPLPLASSGPFIIL